MTKTPRPMPRKPTALTADMRCALTKGCSLRAPHKAVVLSQVPDKFRATLFSQASALGYISYRAETRREIAALADRWIPELAIIYADTATSYEAIEECTKWRMHAVAITDAPCLVRAGEAIRRGATAVLARPATFAQALATLEGQPQEDPTPMSLDRAIWEYLNQTLLETGSISAAARRLRLDRTSFKRMLRKRPF
jgi:ActR/RegA family two-component response regulator